MQAIIDLFKTFEPGFIQVAKEILINSEISAKEILPAMPTPKKRHLKKKAPPEYTGYLIYEKRMECYYTEILKIAISYNSQTNIITKVTHEFYAK